MVDLKKIFKGVPHKEKDVFEDVEENGKEHFDKGHDDVEAIVVEDREHIEQAKDNVEDIIDKSKDKTFINKVR
jgi:hypothetical protein